MKDHLEVKRREVPNSLLSFKSGTRAVELFLALGIVGFEGVAAVDGLTVANSSGTYAPTAANLPAVITAESIGLHASDLGFGTPSEPQFVGDHHCAFPAVAVPRYRASHGLRMCTRMTTASLDRRATLRTTAPSLAVAGHGDYWALRPPPSD